MADAWEHAERTAKPEIGEAIPPRLFRPCVLDATNQHRRFEPAAHVAANQPLEARESSAHERRQFPGVRVATATRYALVAGLPQDRYLGKALHEQVALHQSDDEVRHAPALVLEEPQSIASGP